MTTPSVSESTSFSSDYTDESRGEGTSVMSLEEAFSGSTLTLVTAEKKPSSSSDIVEVSERLYQTRGYYRDSSGRSSLHLQLRLSCSSDEALETIRDSNCILPVPLANSTTNGDDDKTDSPTNHSGNKSNASHISLEERHPDKMSSLRLEVESDPDQDDGSPTWCVLAVEGVTISKTSVEGRSIRFDVEVTARAPSTAPGTDDSTLSILRSQLQMRAILSRPQHHQSVLSAPVDPLAAGLLALELGGSTVLMDSTPSLSEEHQENGRLTKQYYGTSLTSLPAVHLNIELTQAVLVTVTEVGGARAAAGATLVSLTIQHPNTHDETLTITNIAFHSGQSRLAPSTTTATGNNASASNSHAMIADGTNEMTSTGASSFSSSISHADGKRSMQGGQLSVIDMSRSVRWGYAPGTAPTLPLVLKPHEAFATVIVVDAGDNLESRAFASPVAVTALVGTKQDDESKKKMVLIAADARWTTARVAVEPADAFRIDLSLRESQCKVGAPLVVQLKVLNLSHQTRDLMLLMAKDDDNNKTGGVNMLTTRNRKSPLKKSLNTNNDKQEEEHCGVNTAVVSEVNGYTFGVWGLSGDDDGTIRHNRDHELLAVDAALLLGQVKGQQFIEAELRFVPLREGTLDVPNLRLYDKIAGNWYNCIHMLKIVAAAKG